MSWLEVAGMAGRVADAEHNVVCASAVPGDVTYSLQKNPACGAGGGRCCPGVL